MLREVDNLSKDTQLKSGCARPKPRLSGPKAVHWSITESCPSSEDPAVQRDLPQNSLASLRCLLSVRNPMPEAQEDSTQALS